MLDILTPISNTIITERAILKSFTVSDSQALYNLIQQNKDRLIDSFPITLDNTSNETVTGYFIQKKNADWEERISFAFGMRESQSNQLIGYINIKNIDWVIPRAELAYFIDSGFEGRGLMKEALNKIIEFCFEELKMYRLFLRVMTSNESSYKIAEGLGFIREGILRKDHRTFDGRLVDLYYYGMTYEDYKKLKN